MTQPLQSSDLSGETLARLRQADVDAMLLRDVRPALPDLVDDPEVREEVDVCVSDVLKASGEGFDGQQAAAYLSALPWMRVMVAPWRGLAAHAGLPQHGPRFASWVTDDPATREALVNFDAMASPLATSPPQAGRRGLETDPVAALAVLGAAYGGLRPDSLLYERYLLPTFRELARTDQLSMAVAALWADLDEEALDQAYGRDVAAEIDRARDLPPGTAVMVLREVARLRPEVRGLEPVIRRGDGRLSTTERLPLYRGYRGPGVLHCRAVVVALVRSGLIDPVDADATFVRAAADSWRVRRHGSEHTRHRVVPPLVDFPDVPEEHR